MTIFITFEWNWWKEMFWSEGAHGSFPRFRRYVPDASAVAWSLDSIVKQLSPSMKCVWATEYRGIWSNEGFTKAVNSSGLPMNLVYLGIKENVIGYWTFHIILYIQSLDQSIFRIQSLKIIFGFLVVVVLAQKALFWLSFSTLFKKRLKQLTVKRP